MAEKNIAIVIAFRDFRDEEYFIPKNIFEKGGIKTITASSSLGIAIGSLGGDAEVDILLSDLKVADYNALIFAGGSGAQKYINNKECNRIIREAAEEEKILGAICIGPAILAKAGVLKGKKATVWSLAMDKTAIKILKESGASYIAEKVVKDGKIITACGPEAAEEFAKAITSAIS